MQNRLALYALFASLSLNVAALGGMPSRGILAVATIVSGMMVLGAGVLGCLACHKRG